MSMINYINSSDSSDNESSNDDADEDRGIIRSTSPPSLVHNTNEDEYPASNDDRNSPSQFSNYSSAASYSSSLSHSRPSMYSNYHTSSSYDALPQKRKHDQVDSDYSTFDDNMSSISSSSSGSTTKKRKSYNYSDCATEVQQEFHVTAVAKNIMRKMGFEQGKGLGRKEQGITAPIEASKQRGRSGLGLKVKELEPADLVWDSSYEEISVKEFPDWLEGDHLPTLTLDKMQDWMKEGHKVMEMESFTDFCDDELLHDILESKTVFDSLGDKDLLMAVKRSNPFENIGQGIFLNRAAMKMANMDKVFDFMFTDPVDLDNRPVVGEMDLLYFADVCAGPGGFSEYVLWRKNWQAKGIGFTLRNECDFKLDNFYAGTPETFEPYYGVKGDGDVFDPDNIESLANFVRAKTDNIGVHFMMADGGFSVAGKENIQELLSKQLYLCQFLVALCIVRTGGHFVCKLFDVFSPFSVGLVYLMYRSFHKISLHKPNTSRPANSERYIICKYKRDDSEDIRQYMFNLNYQLVNYGPDSDIDITECVPMTELFSDTQFFNYIFNSNNKLGRRQLVHLKKVIAFCRDTKLSEPKQNELKQECLAYWEVPSGTRKPDSTPPDTCAAQIFKSANYDFAAQPGEELNSEEKLKSQFLSVLDWGCIPVSNHNECNFFIGCNGKVYMLRKNAKSWTTLDAKVKLNLSPGTLVYGEIVEEVRGSYRSQTRDKFFHIIDAFALGKKNVISRSYTTRIKLCKLYAKALHKDRHIYNNTKYDNSSHSPPVPPMNLRANDHFELKHLQKVFHGIEIRENKVRHNEILICMRDELPKLFRNVDDKSGSSDSYFFPIKGILFYKFTRNPWTVHISKTTGKIYYYQKGHASLNEPPSDVTASALDCFLSRKLWTWDQGVGIKSESPKENVLHMDQLLNFINKMMNH